jgi:TDG/mug DNA glycosylase family protein
VGFSRAELESYRGGTLPDLLGPAVRLLFAGINPGLLTVATQSHFSRRGNRFYPALERAGITGHVIDASAGLRESDADHLRARGIGITSLVARATARADELEPAELVAGARALAERVAQVAPAVVAILGISAYRVAFGEPRAMAGRQAHHLAGAQLWVVPNPSGLNAHATVATLAAAYREVAVAAGIHVYVA